MVKPCLILGVPDHTALAVLDVRVGGADAEELVGAAQLDADVEHHEVVDQPKKRAFSHTCSSDRSRFSTGLSSFQVR